MISADFLMRTMLVLALCFFAYDLSDDIYEFVTEGQAESITHLVIEALIFVGCLLALVYASISIRQANATMRKQEQQLAGFSGEIATQITDEFNRWSLTTSEQEIAWLIIKGYSFNEIAGLRGVKEKTVRQQASAVYSKAGTSNRAEFSAMFLEDLLSFSASPAS